MIDKPGIDEQTFVINLEEKSITQLVIGEDIEIINEPEPTSDGYKWIFKCISDKAFKYFYDICR